MNQNPWLLRNRLVKNLACADHAGRSCEQQVSAFLTLADNVHDEKTPFHFDLRMIAAPALSASA